MKMPTPSVKINTRDFDETLERYRKLSKRDRTTICNTKAFYIARRAVVETPKADDFKIRQLFDLNTGKVAGMIINARRGKRGEKGLYGTEMKKAQALMRAFRLRSVAFLKSGWLPAIKTLRGLAERPGQAAKDDSRSKIIGRPKGDAIPARESLLRCVAIIRNMVKAKGSTTADPLDKFALPALQRAVDAETKSMNDYIERKLRDSAQEAGIKTN